MVRVVLRDRIIRIRIRIRLGLRLGSMGLGLGLGSMGFARGAVGGGMWGADRGACDPDVCLFF